ncbi:MAG: tRNA (adenosine(37)-N6)-dimethylallyltransferase MiaA [Bacteroides sp.]|nr:tRNA (adenosine(37)-N6)-dimethylallyltransferase MiaA [Bacteroides sp.]
MEKTLLVLAGPTAIGKTSCGIQLAEHFSTEIISADSRQIYLETNIGTAVPTAEELGRVKHHFIQSTSLENPYNASRFELDALQTVERLFKDHELVLMVGGSGLYIDAVCKGIDDLPSADPQLRSRLLEQFSQEGLDPLTKRLKELDPISHGRVDLKNHMRVLKALEVSIQTGKPYSSFLSEQKKERPFNILRVALDMDREELYQRINQRVELMMEEGLLDEVKSLVRFQHLTAMKTVGYRELFGYLDGEISLDEAVDLIKRNTRKFARKQLTWFRKGQQYTWFHPEQCEEIAAWIKKQE